MERMRGDKVKKVLLAIMAMILFLAGTTVAGASILYVDTYNSSTLVSSLYSLTTAGTATKVGDIKLGGTTDLFITDIALDLTTGTMYAITTTTLYTLDNYGNPSGGIITATAVGSTGVTDLQGLEVSSTGTIYAASFPADPETNGGLYTLNSSDGSVVNTYSLAPNSGGNHFRDYGDLAFGNILFYGSLVGTNPQGASPTNGIAPIGTTGGTFASAAKPFNPAVDIDGLAFVSQTSTLYGLTRDANLYTINPATGNLTAITTTGFAAGDVAYGMTVPLPASGLLLGSGLLGLGLLGWRRQKRH